MTAQKVGLVLEGGGMRGAYTAGVLDAMMDAEIRFPYVIGVSAGANAGGNYVSGHRERSRPIFVDWVADKRYSGWGNFFREGSYFGMNFLFRTLPDELVPLDYERLHRSETVFKVGITDCLTGEPVYFCQHDHEPHFFVDNIMRASSSLPLLAPPVRIGERDYYDGGVSDAIPIAQSLRDGNEANVIILTHNPGYRREPAGKNLLLDWVLRRYPKISEALRTRPERYNQWMDRIEQLEREGRVYLIQPRQKLAVDRMEKDLGKIEALYRQGYDEGLAQTAQLREWLQRVE